MSEHTETKAIITGAMWLSYLVMIWFSLSQLGNWAILLAFVLMLPLVGAMAFMWIPHGQQQAKSQEESTTSEKRKRERLDSVLRDLSDEDLLRLKQRLSDGTIDDEHLEAELLGTDGELHYRERR